MVKWFQFQLMGVHLHLMVKENPKTTTKSPRVNIYINAFSRCLDIHYSPSSILLLCLYPVQPVCAFLLHIPAKNIIY